MNAPSTSFTALCASLIILALFLTGCTTPPANRPPIYDTSADGEQQLAAALLQAQRENKRVLLNLGANWCSDSHAMFRLLREHPQIRREIEQHYVLTLIDVNRRIEPPRNTNIVARFDDPLGRGIPVLLVLSAEGTLLNRDPEERLADSDHKNPKKALTYLRKWAAIKLP